MSNSHAFSLLEKWYQSRCDGEWEHSYGVTIESLDNPGWTVTIDLSDTPKSGATLERQTIERSEHDWVQYSIKKNKFEIACGPLNLTESIELFVRWFES